MEIISYVLFQVRPHHAARPGWSVKRRCSEESAGTIGETVSCEPGSCRCRDVRGGEEEGEGGVRKTEGGVRKAQGLPLLTLPLRLAAPAGDEGDREDKGLHLTLRMGRIDS